MDARNETARNNLSKYFTQDKVTNHQEFFTYMQKCLDENRNSEMIDLVNLMSKAQLLDALTQLGFEENSSKRRFVNEPAKPHEAILHRTIKTLIDNLAMLKDIPKLSRVLQELKEVPGVHAEKSIFSYAAAIMLKLRTQQDLNTNGSQIIDLDNFKVDTIEKTKIVLYMLDMNKPGNIYFDEVSVGFYVRGANDAFVALAELAKKATPKEREAYEVYMYKLKSAIVKAIELDVNVSLSGIRDFNKGMEYNIRNIEYSLTQDLNLPIISTKLGGELLTSSESNQIKALIKQLPKLYEQAKKANRDARLHIAKKEFASPTPRAKAAPTWEGPYAQNAKFDEQIKKIGNDPEKMIRFISAHPDTISQLPMSNEEFLRIFKTVKKTLNGNTEATIKCIQALARNDDLYELKPYFEELFRNDIEDGYRDEENGERYWLHKSLRPGFAWAVCYQFKNSGKTFDEAFKNASALPFESINGVEALKEIMLVTLGRMPEGDKKYLDTGFLIEPPRNVLMEIVRSYQGDDEKMLKHAMKGNAAAFTALITDYANRLLTSPITSTDTQEVTNELNRRIHKIVDLRVLLDKKSETPSHVKTLKSVRVAVFNLIIEDVQNRLAVKDYRGIMSRLAILEDEDFKDLFQRNKALDGNAEPSELTKLYKMWKIASNIHHQKRMEEVGKLEQLLVKEERVLPHLHEIREKNKELASTTNISQEAVTKFHREQLPSMAAVRFDVIEDPIELKRLIREELTRFGGPGILLAEVIDAYPVDERTSRLQLQDALNYDAIAGEILVYLEKIRNEPWKDKSTNDKAEQYYKLLSLNKLFDFETLGRKNKYDTILPKEATKKLPHRIVRMLRIYRDALVADENYEQAYTVLKEALKLPLPKTYIDDIKTLFDEFKKTVASKAAQERASTSQFSSVHAQQEIHPEPMPAAVATQPIHHMPWSPIMDTYFPKDKEPNIAGFREDVRNHYPIIEVDLFKQIEQYKHAFTARIAETQPNQLFAVLYEICMAMPAEQASRFLEDFIYKQFSFNFADGLTLYRPTLLIPLLDRLSADGIMGLITNLYLDESNYYNKKIDQNFISYVINHLHLMKEPNKLVSALQRLRLQDAITIEEYDKYMRAISIKMPQPGHCVEYGVNVAALKDMWCASAAEQLISSMQQNVPESEFYDPDRLALNLFQAQEVFRDLKDAEKDLRNGESRENVVYNKSLLRQQVVASIKLDARSQIFAIQDFNVDNQDKLKHLSDRISRLQSSTLINDGAVLIQTKEYSELEALKKSLPDLYERAKKASAILSAEIPPTPPPRSATKQKSTTSQHKVANKTTSRADMTVLGKTLFQTYFTDNNSKDGPLIFLSRHYMDGVPANRRDAVIKSLEPYRVAIADKLVEQPDIASRFLMRLSERVAPSTLVHFLQMMYASPQQWDGIRQQFLNNPPAFFEILKTTKENAWPEIFQMFFMRDPYLTRGNDIDEKFLQMVVEQHGKELFAKRDFVKSTLNQMVERKLITPEQRADFDRRVDEHYNKLHKFRHEAESRMIIESQVAAPIEKPQQAAVKQPESTKADPQRVSPPRQAAPATQTEQQRPSPPPRQAVRADQPDKREASPPRQKEAEKKPIFDAATVKKAILENDHEAQNDLADQILKTKPRDYESYARGLIYAFLVEAHYDKFLRHVVEPKNDLLKDVIGAETLDQLRRFLRTLALTTRDKEYKISNLAKSYPQANPMTLVNMAIDLWKETEYLPEKDLKHAHLLVKDAFEIICMQDINLSETEFDAMWKESQRVARQLIDAGPTVETSIIREPAVTRNKPESDQLEELKELSFDGEVDEELEALEQEVIKEAAEKTRAEFEAKIAAQGAKNSQKEDPNKQPELSEQEAKEVQANLEKQAGASFPKAPTTEVKSRFRLFNKAAQTTTTVSGEVSRPSADTKPQKKS